MASPTPSHNDGRLATARQALAAAERTAAEHAAGETTLRSSSTATDQLDVVAAGGRPGRRPDGVPAGQSSSDPDQVARQIVLRQLSVGPRTRQQLADKLRDRGCDDAVAARVLDRMTDVGLVDDESYAEMFVRSRRESKGLATPALRHELRQKGVPDEIADKALEEVQPEHERASAEALVAKRLRTLHGLDREVQTRRLAGFLARKGYSAGMSYEVIRDALVAAEEHRRD
jgi:regulatory protein